MDVYIHGKRVWLNPQRAIAKGGEADIFDLGQGEALKLFKPPHHPDYHGQPAEQQAATKRIAEHQHKLRQLPANLPQRVIQPTALALDKAGQQVLGYTMPLLNPATVLLQYSDRQFRQSGVKTQDVVAIFRDLHTTVAQVHQAGVVIGDFNDVNVLVQHHQAYLIDADSFQFGPYNCRMFTSRFVDPLLCSYQSGRPELVQPHSAESDWYAFTMMLMQCLLFVDAYGGVYKPKDAAKRIPHPARPGQRITIFQPEVVYPKPALHYRALTDDWLHHFQAVFEHDRRGAFPRQLLETIQWQRCTNCGLGHSHRHCPHCRSVVPIVASPHAAQTVRGSVTAVQLFSTPGVILTAALQGGTLHWLYHEQTQFRREDGTIVLNGDLDPTLTWHIQGQQTLLHKAGQWVAIAPGKPPTNGMADAVASNCQHRYWAAQGQLWRDGALGNLYMGDVLSGQTRFWVGDHLGFGFYQAGTLTVAFVFDPNHPGLNDQVALPPWSGQLLHVSCTLATTQCWLFTVTQEQGQTWHRCTVIQANGTIVATAAATVGDDAWLAQAMVNNRTSGNCAAGNFLLAATDRGVIRVEPDLATGTLVKTREFPDTEPFVDSSSQLFAGPDGLYVVTAQTIQRLTLG